MEPEKTAVDMAESADVQSNISTESLLIEMRDMSKKRLFFQRISACCLAGIFLILLLAVVIILPKAVKTLSGIDNVMTKAGNSLSEIDTMAKEITTTTTALNELVTKNGPNLSEAVTSMSNIDYEGLNTAITDLKDSVGPFAGIMKKLR